MRKLLPHMEHGQAFNLYKKATPADTETDGIRAAGKKLSQQKDNEVRILKWFLKTPQSA